MATYGTVRVVNPPPGTGRVDLYLTHGGSQWSWSIQAPAPTFTLELPSDVVLPARFDFTLFALDAAGTRVTGVLSQAEVSLQGGEALWADFATGSITRVGPAASIGPIIYWFQGLPGWQQWLGVPTPVPKDIAIYWAVGWQNWSGKTLRGYLELRVTQPDGRELLPAATQNQGVAVGDSGGGFLVGFQPLTLGHPGTYLGTVVLQVEPV